MRRGGDYVESLAEPVFTGPAVDRCLGEY